ncbi:MAG: hypothetical protein NC394_08855 [Bacteroides sp.]|nr:hypothetical protein [Bacteroides sp.]
MIKAAIEKILSLAAPNAVYVDNYTYTDKHLELLAPPHVSELTFSTLKGFADIIRKERENFPDLTVSVGADCACAFTEPVADDMKREFPYRAEADIPEIGFGRYMPYENMMIALKSKFVPTDELKELVKLLGTITEENRTAVSDDGFTQSVNVKQGIALIGNKAVNPIVRLKPFRTFVEVDQPESEFLVRLRQGGEVALFEADGGAWKLEARHGTAELLRELLSDTDVLVIE